MLLDVLQSGEATGCRLGGAKALASPRRPLKAALLVLPSTGPYPTGEPDTWYDETGG